MTKEEQVKAEHSTLLEEYSAMRAEIISTSDSARQVLNLTLTAIAIFIAAIPSIIQSKLIILFLIIPLFFYALAWTQLRYVYLVLSVGQYLREVLIPSIRRNLIEHSPNVDHDFKEVMSWEFIGGGLMRRSRSRLRSLFFLPIAGANFSVPFLGILLSIGAYVAFIVQTQSTLSSIETVLLAINAVAFLYSVFWGFQAEVKR